MNNIHFFPTISETSVEFPESLIFAITMSLEAFISLLYAYFREKYNFIFKPKGFSLLLIYFCRIFIFFSAAGMIIFSCFDCDHYFKIHSLWAGIFFFSLSFFNICNDIFDYKSGNPAPLYSVSLSAGMFICCLIYGVTYDLTTTIFVQSLSSIFEFCGVLFMLLKQFVQFCCFPNFKIQINLLRTKQD
jgi:hypothetical protein